MSEEQDTRAALRERLLHLVWEWQALDQHQPDAFPHAADMADILLAAHQAEMRCVDPSPGHLELLGPHVPEDGFQQLTKAARRVTKPHRWTARSSALRGLARLLGYAKSEEEQERWERWYLDRQRAQGLAPRPRHERDAHCFVVHVLGRRVLRDLAPALQEVTAQDEAAVQAAVTKVAMAYERVGSGDAFELVKSGFHALGCPQKEAEHLLDFLAKAEMRQHK